MLGKVRLRPVAHYPQRLLAAPRAARSGRASREPCVVVLTPGVYNSAYFEHAWLARAMGVELVEGRDLVCSGGVVRMRDTSGERRVDVIYRRVDDEYLDPVQFKSDSMLGCPGLLAAARAGERHHCQRGRQRRRRRQRVDLHLPPGSGPLLPQRRACPAERGYLAAGRAGRPRRGQLDRLDELVVKPVDGSGGKGLVIGPQASKTELDVLRAQLIGDPRGWIAQPVVQLSTVPTLVGNDGGRGAPCRPAAVRP